MSNDPVTRVLTHAEALKFISEVLPENKAGVALIVDLLAKDLKECGEELSDSVERPCDAGK